MSAVFMRLVDLSITAAILTLAVLALHLIFRKVPRGLLCALWALVAIRLLCPLTLETRLSPIPAVSPAAAIADAVQAEPSTPVTDPVLPGGTISAPADHTAETLPTTNVPAQTAVITSTPVTPVTSADPIPAAPLLPEEPAKPVDLLHVFTVLWLCGIAAVSGWGVLSMLRLRRRVRFAAKVGDRVWQCDEIHTPFLLGVVQPRIYLPSEMGEREQEFVLTHERAHLSRCDHWWKLLGFCLLAVYWFNPVLWLGYAVFCRDMEMACDERVIRTLGDGVKQDYSRTLLACSAPKRLITACPLAFGGANVKQRIRSVLNYKKPAFWVIVLAIVAAVTVGVVFLTRRPADEPQVPELPTDTASLADLPSDYSPEQAAADGCVVAYNSEIVAGQEQWDAFRASAEAKEPARVRIFYQYDLMDPIFYDEAYYASVKDEYPKCYVMDLIFDGQSFLWQEMYGDQLREERYLYLLERDDAYRFGVDGVPAYVHFTLTDDDTLTQKQIDWSMVSSNSNDFIRHRSVFSNRIHPEEQPDTFDYRSLAIPDFTAENPIYYRTTNGASLYNGWQRLGDGLICTVPYKRSGTGFYDQYSWYIRNDLQSLYDTIHLPTVAATLAEFMATPGQGRYIFWYSMTDLVPHSVKLKTAKYVDGGDCRLYRADYSVITENIYRPGEEMETNWAVYYRVDPVAGGNPLLSAYAVRLNYYSETETLTQTLEAFLALSQPWSEGQGGLYVNYRTYQLEAIPAESTLPVSNAIPRVFHDNPAESPTVFLIFDQSFPGSRMITVKAQRWSEEAGAPEGDAFDVELAETPYYFDVECSALELLPGEYLYTVSAAFSDGQSKQWIFRGDNFASDSATETNHGTTGQPDTPSATGQPCDLTLSYGDCRVDTIHCDHPNALPDQAFIPEVDAIEPAEMPLVTLSLADHLPTSASIAVSALVWPEEADSPDMEGAVGISMFTAGAREDSQWLPAGYIVELGEGKNCALKLLPGRYIYFVNVGWPKDHDSILQIFIGDYVPNAEQLQQIKNENSIPDELVDCGTSELYSEEDIRDAVSAVWERLRVWEGCELHRIAYSSDAVCTAENVEWMNRLGCSLWIPGGFTECIMLESDFHVEPDCEYTGYRWWLARRPGESWVLIYGTDQQEKRPVPTDLIDYGTSQLYSKEDIDAAVAAILELSLLEDGYDFHRFAFTGALGDLSQMNQNAVKRGYAGNFTQSIVIECDFHTPAGNNQGFNDDFEYTGWSWWLARTDNGPWYLLSGGY